MQSLTTLGLFMCCPLLLTSCVPSGGADDGAGGGDEGGSGSINGEGGSANTGGTGSQTVVGACTLTQSELSANGTIPSIAATEDGFAIAYLSDQQIRLAVLDDKGTVKDDVVVAEAAAPGLISVQMAGPALEVVWADGSTIRARPMSLAGAPLEAPMVVATTESDEPRPHGAAQADGTMGLVWMNQPAIEGVVLEDGSEVDTSAATGWYPTLLTGEDGLGMAWSEGAQEGPLAFGFFDTPEEFTTVPDSAALIKTGVSKDGTYYVIWEDIGNGDEPVVDIAAFDASRKLLGRASVSPGDASANWPAIAATDTGLMVTYYQFREGPATVYAQKLNPSMEPDEEEFELAEGAKYPSVAFAHGTTLFGYHMEDSGSLRLTTSVCE